MRKETLLLLNLFFLSTHFLVAQSVDLPKNIAQNIVDIRVSIADTSNNSFFLKRNDLKEISRVFQNDELHSVAFRYQDQDSELWNIEYYDMNFEGDVFVFKNKYKNSIHFIEPKIDVQQIYRKNIEGLNGKQIRTIIRQDTVTFDIRLECESDSMRRDIPGRTHLGVPAEYAGDLKTLSSTIEKHFSETNSAADIDSTVVFRGVVDVSGDMNSLILEAGEQSAFSDAVKNALNVKDALNPSLRTLRKRQFWIPARIERGPVKSNIRIYAKLNDDGSVRLSTTRLLGTISIFE